MYYRTCSTPFSLPNGKEWDCVTVSVVYLMSSNECGKDYMGETGSPLCVRGREHLDGLKKCNVMTPWGERYV